MQIKLIAINCRYTHSCPALFYVRNELRRHLPGVACDIHQFALNDPYYRTLLRIAEEKPAAIFFSVYIWSSSYISKLVHDLGHLLPSVPIVLGGPQVSYGNAGVTDFPDHCTIVRGEVEGLPEQFYHDLHHNRLQREYRASTGRPFSLPYQEHDFVDQLKNRQVYYESSRGCPFSCTYCLSSVESGVRHKDLGHVRAELLELLSHRPGTVRFVDRTFNASPERAIELWRFLAAQDGATLFHFEIAPELFTDEMFAFLAGVEPGRFQFEIGLQSTNPQTLAAVRRPADIERVRTNLRRLMNTGNIHLHVDLILGLPFETKESFRRSFNEVFSLFPHYIQVGLLKVLPGTALAMAAEDFGLVACQQPPYEILATRWLPAEELADLYWLGECAEAFFNNRYFRTLFAYLRRTEPDPFGFFEELLAVCRRRGFFALATTQDLVCRLLLEVAANRADRDLFLELLRFDWLLSGQRSLPGYLDGPSSVAIKDMLRLKLPQNWSPHFTYKDREEFFKLGIFAGFTAAALKEAGLTDGNRSGYVRFPADRTIGVLKPQNVLLLIPGAVPGLNT
jgi:anaerobic magnesium-protoporphyrin IX monomethyl ester cyclase